MVLGAAFLSCNAQAQSVDSATEVQPHIVAAQVKDSTKRQTKTIRIACASTIPAGREPLFIVDGRPIEGLDLKSIVPDDIDRIEVLKGNAATALYGSRGANGVILIFLKHLRTKPFHQLIEKKARLD
ncbi:hypothetical protein GCM10027044_34760 [Hymenobacter ruber]